MNMSTSKKERDKKPARLVVLPPKAYADDWPSKPAVESAVGLRFVSQRDFDEARKEAERVAQGFYREFSEREKECSNDTLLDVFNDAFLANIVARGTCNPNDVTQPYFPLPDDMVAAAWTPETLRRIWDELVILHKGGIDARPAATDEEIKRLCAALPHNDLDLETRRLCAYLLEKLGPLAEIPDEEEDGVYYATAS